MFKKTLTPEQALQKLRQYCGYQERSHHEVQQKLYDLGVWKQDHDSIIATLIEQDYLNEERFVKAYAGGRFRMKHWGRIKIRYELKQKKISDYLLKKAMAEIPEEDYRKVMEKLVTDKYDSLGSDQYIVRQKKTIDYMTGKGYETNLVIPFLNQLVRDRRDGAREETGG
ncbi:MAG: RecX family transcriptional regulator [Chitinophagaceae bacterium]|nr:MAG: RecX family transcriptional regulator [Chitinophagaceae bacterium]